MEQGPVCPLPKENPKLPGHRATTSLCLSFCFTKWLLHTLVVGTEAKAAQKASAWVPMGTPDLLTCTSAPSLHSPLAHSTLDALQRKAGHAKGWIASPGMTERMPVRHSTEPSMGTALLPWLAQENTQTPKTWASDSPYQNQRNIHLSPPRFLATGLLCKGPLHQHGPLRETRSEPEQFLQEKAAAISFRGHKSQVERGTSWQHWEKHLCVLPLKSLIHTLSSSMHLFGVSKHKNLLKSTLTHSQTLPLASQDLTPSCQAHL